MEKQGSSDVPESDFNGKCCFGSPLLAVTSDSAVFSLMDVWGKEMSIRPSRRKVSMQCFLATALPLG